MEFNCYKLEALAPLREKWERLERAADPGFMLSWSWIGTWLETIATDATIVEGCAGDETVLLAILFPGHQKRHGFVSSRQLHLNATGCPEKDLINIEFNRPLVHPACRADADIKLIGYLKTDSKVREILGKWDELVFSNASEGYLDSLRENGMPRRVFALHESFAADLAGIREQGKDFVGSLSKNTRAQIRKSIRLFEEGGPLRLERADTRERAHEWFDALAPLHDSRWAEKNGVTLQSNRWFIDFHKSLIDHCWPKGEIELARITAGGHIVGYLYNFIQGGHVYFYLSALSYSDNPRLKPGLVCHVLCAQRHLDEGRDLYDFMAGNQRYKANLGEYTETLVSAALQRPKLDLGLERFLSAVKDRIKG